MFLRLSTLFLETNVLCLSAGNRKRTIGNALARAAKTLLSLGAPDCPVVHPTVRCARLARANSLLSGFHRRRTTIIHRTVRCAPDCPVSQRSAGPTVGCAICARHVAEPTVGRGHQTVSGAPTAPRRQRSALPQKERNPHQTVSGVHRTVRCARRQKARIAFPDCSQRLLAALGL
jgi:hypothetical protein